MTTLREQVVNLRRELGEGVAESSENAVSAAATLAEHRLSDDARRLLFGIGAIAREPVHLQLIDHVVGGGKSRTTLEELGRLQLVQQEGDRYGVHDAIRRWALQTLAKRLDADVPSAVVASLADWYLNAAAASAEVLQPFATPQQESDVRSAAAFFALEAENMTAVLDAAIGARLDHYAWGLANLLAPHFAIRSRWVAWRDLLLRLEEVTTRIGDPEVEAMRLNNLGIAEARLSLSSAEQQFRRSREQAAMAGDTAGEARALAGIAGLMRDHGRTDDAVAAFNEALLRYSASSDVQGEARTLGDLGNLLDDPSHAIELHRSSLDKFHELGDTWGAAKQQMNLGRAMVRAGDLTGAIEAMRVAPPMFLDVDDVLGAALSYFEIGNISVFTGEPEAALEALREAERLAASIGEQHLLANIFFSRGNLYQGMGEISQAREMHVRAREGFGAVRDSVAEGIVLSRLALVEIAAGESALAREYLASAQALLEETDEASHLAGVLLNRSTLEAAAGKFNESLMLRERARLLFEHSGDVEGLVMALLALGTSYRMSGREAEAEEVEAEAQRLAAENGLIGWSQGEEPTD
jgi:tetratricopeptide (TPR) repeat protein